MARSIFWFRRDLRIEDNPALNAAIDSSDEIIPVFILDENLIKESGSKRLAYLGASLHELDKSLDGNLHVMVGDQVTVLKELMERYGASEVHISEEFEPYGKARDLRVEKAGIKLVRTGSPYAVAPGRVRKPSDYTPYKVYTPFYRAWLDHGWRAPAPKPKTIKCVKPSKNDRNFPEWKAPEGFVIPPAGEAAALKRWGEFKKKALNSYDEERNFAGIDGTSKLSHHLK